MAAQGFPVQVCCRVLEVSESGFYAWRSRPPSSRAICHAWLTDAIHQVHAASRQTYGSRRVHAELTLGVTGRPKFRRGLRPEATAADLVQRQFDRTGPDQLWVTDITEHPTREGKLYCAVVLDACSRRVVGWSIDAAPTAALVTNALGMAIQSRRPAAGTLIHSDQGVQGAVHQPGLRPPPPAGRPGRLHGHSRRRAGQRRRRELFATLEGELLDRHAWPSELGYARRCSTSSRSSTTASVDTAPSTTTHPSPTSASIHHQHPPHSQRAHESGATPHWPA
jgi:transposase InsO family protein